MPRQISHGNPKRTTVTTYSQNFKTEHKRNMKACSPFITVFLLAWCATTSIAQTAAPTGTPAPTSSPAPTILKPTNPPRQDGHDAPGHDRKPHAPAPTLAPVAPLVITSAPVSPASSPTPAPVATSAPVAPTFAPVANTETTRFPTSSKPTHHRTPRHYDKRHKTAPPA